MGERVQWKMPNDIQAEIAAHGLDKQYASRPPYQRNDYIGWINQAKRPETRQRRIDQMIAELEQGDRYMNMPWGKNTPKSSTPKNTKPKTLSEFITVAAKNHKAEVVQLDKCITSLHPHMTAKAAWGSWAYQIEGKYSCMIVPYKDHIKLMIWRGTMLDDPKNLLLGNGINTRHMRFYSNDDVDCDYLSKLLTQQIDLYNSGLEPEDKN